MGDWCTEPENHILTPGTTVLLEAFVELTCFTTILVWHHTIRMVSILVLYWEIVGWIWLFAGDEAYYHESNIPSSGDADVGGCRCRHIVLIEWLVKTFELQIIRNASIRWLVTKRSSDINDSQESSHWSTIKVASPWGPAYVNRETFLELLAFKNPQTFSEFQLVEIKNITCRETHRLINHFRTDQQVGWKEGKHVRMLDCTHYSPRKVNQTNSKTTIHKDYFASV